MVLSAWSWDELCFFQEPPQVLSRTPGESNTHSIPEIEWRQRMFIILQTCNQRLRPHDVQAGTYLTETTEQKVKQSPGPDKWHRAKVHVADPSYARGSRVIPSTISWSLSPWSIHTVCWEVPLGPPSLEETQISCLIKQSLKPLSPHSQHHRTDMSPLTWRWCPDYSEDQLDLDTSHSHHSSGAVLSFEIK